VRPIGETAEVPCWRNHGPKTPTGARTVTVQENAGQAFHQAALEVRRFVLEQLRKALKGES